jgi:hypothetical protein
LLVSFQCDFCWFQNLKGRSFNNKSSSDRMNLALIRRANLDMFWSRETSTVLGMYRLFEQATKAAVHLGIEPEMLKGEKKWPLGDRVGFGEAVLILWQSLQKGKNVETHQQFDTIRKIRSLAANLKTARSDHAYDGVGFKEGGKVFSLKRCETDSVFFTSFMKGCEKRMGRTIRQDAAISVGLLLKLLENLQAEFLNPNVAMGRKREVVMLEAALVIGFCGALRGNEIFLVEGSQLCAYQHKGRMHENPHVVIPMMGRFKGETGERNILWVLVPITKSGIQIEWWVDCLIKLLKEEGRNDTRTPGPAFCDESGFVLAYSTLNGWFHEEMVKLQRAHPETIPSDLDIVEVYNLYRSLRRGATSRATALNYSETVINLNNRWRMTQSNKGKGGLIKMSQLYVEVTLVLEGLLEFSASL